MGTFTIRDAGTRSSAPRVRRKWGTTPQKRAIETRRQILLAAASLFREKGYKATTLRDIADVARMGAGGMYYYFDSKEDLLLEVLDIGISTIDSTVRASVDALPQNANHLDRLREALRAHLHTLLATDEYATAYARIYSQLPPNVKRRDHPARIAYIQYWCDLIAAAQENGKIRKTIAIGPFVDFLLGSMSRATEWYDPATGTPDQLAYWIADWTFNGIAAPASKRL